MNRAASILVAILSLALLAAAAAEEDRQSPQERALARELALRYAAGGWSGRPGPVVAGIGLEHFERAGMSLRPDHQVWLDLRGERVLRRELVSKDGSYRVAVAVARTCEGAQQILLDHLTRPRSLAVLDRPALPYGEIRLDAIGDAAFGLPLRGDQGFHSIAFCRFNVAVALVREPAAASPALAEAAANADRAILARPRFNDWQSSAQWPAIVRFEAAAALPASQGDLVPLAARAAPGAVNTLARAFELTAGGIVEQEGGTFYHAEGAGPQTVTLLVADGNGLADSARLELIVLE